MGALPREVAFLCVREYNCVAARQSRSLGNRWTERNFSEIIEFGSGGGKILRPRTTLRSTMNLCYLHSPLPE